MLYGPCCWSGRVSGESSPWVEEGGEWRMAILEMEFRGIGYPIWGEMSLAELISFFGHWGNSLPREATWFAKTVFVLPSNAYAILLVSEAV